MNDLAGIHAGASSRRMANELALASPLDALLSRVLNYHTSEKSWRKGARGEVNVAAKLRNESAWVSWRLPNLEISRHLGLI